MSAPDMRVTMSRAELITWLQDLHARAVNEATIMAETLALLGAPLTSHPSPVTSLFAPDGITQDSYGPEVDLPPGLRMMLREDFDTYRAGRAENALCALSWRQFVAALTAVREPGADVASILRAAEEAAGLLTTAAS